MRFIFGLVICGSLSAWAGEPASKPARGVAADSLVTLDGADQKASSLAVRLKQRHYRISFVP
jgi:hypothetical protein